MQVIYEPRGEAGEYADLGLNLGRGCSHFCRYCYNLKDRYKAKVPFHAGFKAKVNILERFKHDAARLRVRGDDREILLSFTADPYDPSELETELTRQTIKILIANDLRFTILTKGGMRAERDVNGAE